MGDPECSGGRSSHEAPAQALGSSSKQTPELLFVHLGQMDGWTEALGRWWADVKCGTSPGDCAVLAASTAGPALGVAGS